MKDYYKILGVDRKAPPVEIKKAFRKLAIAYHPDHNPSRDAERIIKEIIEAYETLDDPFKRQLYDSLQVDKIALEEAERIRRDPRYQRARSGPAHKTDNELMIEMMKKNMRYAVFVSWCTMAFSFFLVLDFMKAPVEKTETIRGFAKHIYVGESERLLTETGKEFKIDQEHLVKLKSGETITIAYSPWLGVPRFFRYNQNRQETKVPATLYANFIFAPIFLLAASLTGVVYRKGIMFRFNLGIVNFLLLLLNILFLFIHHLHLT